MSRAHIIYRSAAFSIQNIHLGSLDDGLSMMRAAMKTIYMNVKNTYSLRSGALNRRNIL
jgi:hypothetical protein